MLFLRIKPTEYSETYTILLKSAPKRKNVEVYVIEPRIGVYMDGRKVPHMYPNGSLCLFYPDYEEWDLREKWGDTLVPWASLWLYYYEIWKETDAWLGGGIHGKPDKESVREVNETDK